MTGIEKTGNSQGTPQSSESFKSFADRLNASIPEQTSTVPEKRNAINVKKQIMAHSGCPSEVKNKLQKEISILEQEIARIEGQNSSIFDK